MKLYPRLLSGHSGASLLEFALLAAGMSVVMWATAPRLTQGMRTTLCKINAGIANNQNFTASQVAWNSSRSCCGRTYGARGYRCMP